MEKRTLNKTYEKIGKSLIRREKSLRHIKGSNVVINYLSSDSEKKSKGRLVFGECEKVPDKFRWAVPCDFTVTIFEPNIEHFSKEQLRILILHELMHVGIEKDGNEETYFVVPHDIEDFKEVLDRFGVDWWQ